MVKVAIIGYTVLHLFFYSCSYCMSDSRFWMPYYIIDEMFGGGALLWFIAFRYSKKYSVPCFLVFVFSLARFFWNVWCYVFTVNASDTKWTFILFLCLLPGIYYTLFCPGSRTVNFLSKALRL